MLKIDLLGVRHTGQAGGTRRAKVSSAELHVVLRSIVIVRLDEKKPSLARREGAIKINLGRTASQFINLGKCLGHIIEFHNDIHAVFRNLHSRCTLCCPANDAVKFLH